MRLFAGDIVPGLSAFAQEMPAPWIFPGEMDRVARDRLAALLGRAICHFDPRVRFVQLRWEDRRALELGRLSLPHPALLWWRIDRTVFDANQVLIEAPRISSGHCLLDFDGDPGIESLGWLGPLKRRLLHALTDVLSREKLVDDPEAAIDLLNDLAGEVRNPLDLLDFTEALFAARADDLDWRRAGARARSEIRARRDRSIPLAPSPEPSEEASGGPRDAAALTALEDEAAALLERIRGGEDRAWSPDECTEVAYVLWRLAEASERPPTLIERMERAAALYEVAAQVLERGGHRPLVVQALVASARGWRRTHALARALRLSAHARELAEKIGDDGGRSASLIELGLAWQSRGDLDKALPLLQEARLLSQQLGDQRGEARAQRALGMLWHQQGAQDEPRQALLVARAIYQQLADRHGEADTLVELAQITWAQSELAGVLSGIEEAERFYRVRGEQLREATALLHKAQLLWRTGDHQAADSALAAALAAYRAAGDTFGEACVQQRIAEFCMQRLDLQKSRGALSAALTLYRGLAAAHPDAFLPELAQTLSVYAYVEGALGHPEQAAAMLRESVDIYQELVTGRSSRYLGGLKISLDSLRGRIEELGESPAEDASYTDGLRTWTACS